MSAIEPLGYPDWQRLTNWDGPILWNPASGQYVAQLASPIMRVDRYQSIGGIFNLTGAAQIGFLWTPDQAQSVLLSQRVFYLDGRVSQQALQFRLVNLAAWCQVIINPIGGSFTLLAPNIVAPNNRAYPAELFGGSPILFDVQNVNVAAGATFTAYAPFVASGRAHFTAIGPSASSFVSLQMCNAQGNYDLMHQQVFDSSGSVYFDVAMPQSTVKLQIKNGTAAATACWAALVSAGGTP